MISLLSMNEELKYEELLLKSQKNENSDEVTVLNKLYNEMSAIENSINFTNASHYISTYESKISEIAKYLESNEMWSEIREDSICKWNI